MIYLFRLVVLFFLVLAFFVVTFLVAANLRLVVVFFLGFDLLATAFLFVVLFAGPLAARSASKSMAILKSTSSGVAVLGIEALVVPSVT